MAALAMRMPPDIAESATLATPVVTEEAPVWAVAHDAVIPHHSGHFEVKGRRTYRDIFRIPNMGGILREWLYTRPTLEAIGEDAFENSAAECTTIFRIEEFDPDHKAVTITPTVSNNWLLVPCQTINGFTVGLTYVDTMYQRDESGMNDNRVPPLRIGRFVIEDATGEIFVSAWTANIMVVGWIQSMLKCERVRELLLFQAPPSDGLQPRNLLLRNSFYERRRCFLCGSGASITQLPPACSAINKRGPVASTPQRVDMVQGPPRLTNIATLYRRFRGSYFGVVLKTKYGRDRMPVMQQLVPVFIDVKNGLHSVKQRFRNNLRRNVDFVLDAASADAYFGVNPRACQRVLMLRASHPVDSFALPAPPGAARGAGSAEADGADSGEEQRCADGRASVERSDTSETTRSAGQQRREQSVASFDTDVTDPALPAQRRRVRVEDSLERDSVLHKRKVRNRESAARSNKLRKMILEQKRSELGELQQRLPALRAREAALRQERDALRIRVYGASAVVGDVDTTGGAGEAAGEKTEITGLPEEAMEAADVVDVSEAAVLRAFDDEMKDDAMTAAVGDAMAWSSDFVVQME